MLLGAGFRLISFQREALGGDEMFSRRVVTEPLPLAYAEVRDDLVHPPLYYLLLKAGTSLWGADALGLRALSLFCGIASIGLIAILGNRLPGARWCGLLAAAALAVNRYQLFYSQEARSYAFYTLLVVLLVLWVDAISKRERDPRLWLTGASLMTLLVYTHYYGILYVIATILTLLMCNLERRTKLTALASAAAAAVLLAPWLYVVSSAYKKKQGLDQNLGWMHRPTLQDLGGMWAKSLDTMGLRHSAIALVLLLMLALAVIALVLVSKNQTLRRTPAVVALVMLSVLPPLIIFLLSNPPFNMPLFNLRHFLPSMALLLLLCCFGLERLSEASKRAAPLIAICGSVLILLLGAIPAIKTLEGGPMRFPWYELVDRVKTSDSLGVQAFASTFKPDGEAVNFYCKSMCVLPLPENQTALPNRLLFIYVFQTAKDDSQYNQLILSGYTETDRISYYIFNLNGDMEVVTATLERR
jgi:4-amino-4-deoxy-L-arabinose transferase-like glycosyltransferase